MRLRITIAMLEIRNRETLQSKVNICKSDVKIDDYADSLTIHAMFTFKYKLSITGNQFRSSLNIYLCAVLIISC